MTKHRREPIQIRAIHLSSIFFIALVVITLTSYISNFISTSYQARLDNQRAHGDLGKLILSNLILLESEFNKLAYLEDPRDLEISQEEISTSISEIQEILQILQNGGVYKKTIPANFDTVEEIETTIVYKRTDNEGYLVEALELLPRVLDVQDIANKLKFAAEERLSASTADEKLASAQISILRKQAETFLLRSQESANRIYYESHAEIQQIEIERDKAIQKVRSLSIAIILGVALGGGSLSFYMLQQISALLKARANAEKHLREAELRYRTVADFTYAWEYWRNPDGHLEYVSPSSERITGYPAESILADPAILDKIIYDDDKLIWQKHGDETSKNRSRQEIHFRIYRKDREVIWIEHVCQPVTTPTGEFVGYRASNRDITKKLNIQAALQDSEKRYRSLVENSPIGIILASRDGEILSINAYALTMLGSPSKEASEKVNLLTFPPLVVSGFVQDFRTCLQTEETIHNETAYRSKWGIHLYSRYTLTAIRDADADLIGIQILLEDITEQTHDKADLQRQLKNLRTINAINTSIITRTDLEGMVETILREIITNLSVDAADLLIYDEYALTLSSVAQQGFRSPRGRKPTVLRISDGYAGEAALKRKMIRIRDLNDSNLTRKTPERWQEEKFQTYFGVPLLIKGELKGILEIFHRTKEKRDQTWFGFLETLAQQIAIAIDNHFLLDALQRSNLELELAYETTLEGWARALELRDYETKGHTERVTTLTLALAQTFGIQGEALTHIRRGALLHDIGKIAVSDTILLKPGPCTEEEWVIIRQHPQYGYDMLKEITYLKPSLDIVLYHHEHWDGGGYPHGLAGEDIPFSARLFAIIDVWDALINERPYHKAWSHEITLAHIAKEKGKHFDPDVVDAFLKMIEGYL